MAAVTAVQNPSNRSEILLFYCADTQFVNLNRITNPGDQKNREDDEGFAVAGKSPVNHGVPLSGTHPSVGAGDPTGPIRNPSSFGSVLWKELLFVFGIRAIDGAICRVSPDFQPVRNAPIAKTNSLAACGDGRFGWIYYISDKTDPGVISEYKLQPESYQLYEPIPDANSALAAYYDASNAHRYCIYQKSGTLRWFSAQDEEGGSIQYSTNAKAATPLAACTVAGKAYLFYADTQSDLVVIISGMSRAWGQPIVIKEALRLSATTRLTAVPTADKTRIEVYYVEANDATRFYEFTYYL